MIGEFLLNIVFGIATRFFALLPDISWNADSTAIGYMISILRVAGYVFPWVTVLAIVRVVLMITMFRIVISFIKTIWDILPFA